MHYDFDLAIVFATGLAIVASIAIAIATRALRPGDSRRPPR